MRMYVDFVTSELGHMGERWPRSHFCINFDRRKRPPGARILMCFTLGCGLGGGNINSGKQSNNPPEKQLVQKDPTPGPTRPKDPPVGRVLLAVASFARVYISSSAPQCERILSPGGRF